MTPVGETLRRERERRNLDLEQISRETKISARLLEAIEEERFEKLPGGVFAKSFVRQYARYLGLDEDELVEEVHRMLHPSPVGEAGLSEVKEPPPVPRVEEWQIAGESRWKVSSSLPALAMVVVVMLACSLVYNWWQNRRARPAQPESPALVQQQPPQQPPSPAATVPPAVPPEAAPPAAARPTAAPEPVTAAVPPQTGGAAAPQPSPAVPAAAQADPNAPLRIELVAAENTWVSVRADGKYVFSGTLQANETRTASGTESVVVRLGNAGGVTIRQNGKELGAVGPKGQVRTVQFTSGGFQIVPPASAAPKAAPPDPLL